MSGQIEPVRTTGESPAPNIRKDFFSLYYIEHGRQFPWREETTDAYGILVAEILLKQTQANRVAIIWPSVIRRYRDPGALSVADPCELSALISDLGFGNQRTVALIRLARAIEASGQIPHEVDELISLPYVGIYTGHALACFVFGQRVPVVDLSIVRLISRIMGSEPPSDIRRAPAIWEIAWTLLPAHRIKEHNYGLLDFAATVCKPRAPLCNWCSIASECDYGKGRQSRQHSEWSVE